MATIFKYNNKLYQAMNLDKKLKRLKLSKNDIDIIFEGNCSQNDLEKKFLELSNKKEKESDEYEDPNRLYYFINKKTKYSITSIYPVCNEQGYEPTTLEYLQTLWNK